MTVLYLDTEFNGFGGELISLALVGRGVSFYEVVAIPYDVNPWVAEHVVPFLGKDPVGYEAFQTALSRFIGMFDGPVEIVADSPADFVYLMRALERIDATGNYDWFKGALTLRYDPWLSAERGGRPHNALEDAWALLDSDRKLRRVVA